MSEDVARAVGSGNGVVTINGKPCKLRPLTLKELGEVERQCLIDYQDSYVETFARTASKFFTPEERKQLIMEKAEEAARWDISNLPLKFAHAPASVKYTPELQKSLSEKYGEIIDIFKDNPQKLEVVVQRLAATELDAGALSYGEYERLTGTKPVNQKIGYANWWFTATSAGRIATMVACFDGQVTREEILAELSKDPGKIVEACREIEEMTRPAVGNT